MKERTNQVHLYLINDIYVPGSYVLELVSSALQDGYTKISSLDAGAKVTISTGDSSSTIQNAIMNHWYTKDEWRSVANAISSQTKGKIVFLASFLSLIKDLTISSGITM